MVPTWVGRLSLMRTSNAAIHISPVQQVGRYTICDQLAAGGMATVHLARLVGSAGFSRVVAAKRMHRHFAADPDFKRMFLAEAQLAARVQHPNVVPILDVLTHEDELIIFMEYVHGEALHSLLRATSEQQSPIPIPIGCAIIAGALHGLHAAHEARSEFGSLLGIVHRDISPQNILVGVDGVTRVLDFGIAKALSEHTYTDPGTLKGKFSYMAPEALRCEPITRRTDIFSAGVVLWELLTSRKLFGSGGDHDRLRGRAESDCPSPRQFNAHVSEALSAVVGRALQTDPSHRFGSALDFAIALEEAVTFAPQHAIGQWVQEHAAKKLAERTKRIQALETTAAHSPVRPSIPPLHSGPVLTAPDPTQRLAPTAVATPVAKRRVDKRAYILFGTGVGIAILLAVLFGLRPQLDAPKELVLDGATTNVPATNVPAGITAVEPTRDATSAPEIPVRDAPPTTVAPSRSKTRSATAKASPSRSTPPKSGGTKARATGRVYLPSQL